LYKEIENVAVFSSKFSPAAGSWPAALRAGRRVLNAGAHPGIIDRAAWDIARNNDQAAGPVIRIANSRSNRASTASIIYSNGTKVIYFNRYVQRTVRINDLMYD
jgi:hypothetical protein